MSEPHGPAGPPTAPGPLAPPTGPVYGPIHRYRLPSEEPRPDAPGDGAPHPSPPSPHAARTYPRAAPLGPAADSRQQPSMRPWDPPGPSTPGRRDDHASWGRRVAGAVIDALPAWVAAAVLAAGYLPTYLGFLRGDLSVLPRYPLVVVGSLLGLAAFGWAAHNRWSRAGRTGQSVGRRVTKTWLVDQTTGRPVGPFHAFLRDLLHVLDGFGCVGYLWPLWDDERQTLADKIALTVVVRTAVPPLTELERDRG